MYDCANPASMGLDWRRKARTQNSIRIRARAVRCPFPIRPQIR